MRILYIIVSCETHLLGRTPSSVNTWVKNINEKSDYFILSKSPDNKKVIGYDTRDDYWSLPEKFLNFFTKFDFKDFEWVFIIDDDGYCFPKRIEDFLLKNNYNYQDNIGIGHRNCDFSEMGEKIFCGGSGTILSMGAVNLIREMLKNEEDPIRYLCGDCALFDWMKKVNSKLIHASDEHGRPLMFPSQYRNFDGIFLNTALTYHYCDENDKYFLNNIK